MSVVYSRRMNVNIYYVLATLQEAKQGANPESELIQSSLSWGGGRELITPLIVTQTCMRTVIPRWVPAVEGAAPHLLQIPTLTRWDKQNSKLMKPFLSWAPLDFDWTFTSFEISFRKYLSLFPFLENHFSILWAGAKPHRLVAPIIHCSLGRKTPPTAGISPSSHWFSWHIRTERLSGTRWRGCGIIQGFFLLLFFFPFPCTLVTARLSAEGNV